jgi:hypothetical protein
MINKNKLLFYIPVVILAGVVAVLVFFHFYLRSQGIIPKVERQGDITIEENYLGYHIIAPYHVPLNDVFDIATEKADFHVYYPTFLSDTLVIDRNSIWVSASDNIANYDLMNTESTSSLIYVVQKSIKPGEENSILKRKDRFQSKETFLSNKCTGGITQSTTINKFTHLVCSTEENVAIWLRTDSFDLATLVSIAESMR